MTDCQRETKRHTLEAREGYDFANIFLKKNCSETQLCYKTEWSTL